VSVLSRDPLYLCENQEKPGEILGSHSSLYEDDCLLGCYAV
jgi:hypothetical protein